MTFVDHEDMRNRRSSVVSFSEMRVVDGQVIMPVLDRDRVFRRPETHGGGGADACDQGQISEGGGLAEVGAQLTGKGIAD